MSVAIVFVHYEVKVSCNLLCCYVDFLAVRASSAVVGFY